MCFPGGPHVHKCPRNTTLDGPALPPWWGALSLNVLCAQALKLFPESVSRTCVVLPQVPQGTVVFGGCGWAWTCDGVHTCVCQDPCWAAWSQWWGRARKGRAVSHRLGEGFSVLLVLNLKLLPGHFEVEFIKVAVGNILFHCLLAWEYHLDIQIKGIRASICTLCPGLQTLRWSLLWILNLTFLSVSSTGLEPLGGKDWFYLTLTPLLLTVPGISDLADVCQMLNKWMNAFLKTGAVRETFLGRFWSHVVCVLWARPMRLRQTDGVSSSRQCSLLLSHKLLELGAIKGLYHQHDVIC